MNSCEIVSLVTAISCAIANCVPREDLPLVTSIIGQIAATLTTITVNEDLIHPIKLPGGPLPDNKAPIRGIPGGEIPEFDIEGPPDTDILTEPPFTIR